MFELDGNQAILNGTSYVVAAKANSNVVDSFVINSNKIGTGSGEARLYVSSQSNELHSNAFFNFNPGFIITKDSKGYVGSPFDCFFSKDNLVKYMEDARVEYNFPSQSHRENISLFYEERLEVVNDLTNVTYFKIYHQHGDLDSRRFYIGSTDIAWELMRQISLPKITSIEIYKLVNGSDPSDIKFYLELKLNSEQGAITKSSKISTESKIGNRIKNDLSIDETEKQSIIKSRRGQGKFRRNTLALMPTCPFTGVDAPYLLRASHIMPWAKCRNNQQRVDGYNGLSLTPTYDLLFDLGLISFKNDGSLLLSRRLKESVSITLNLMAGETYNIGNEEGNKSPYLKYHFENVFLK